MTKDPSQAGIGFYGALTIAFVVLKLTHVIDWSWWWISSPLWGTASLLLLGYIGFVIASKIIQYIHRDEIAKMKEADKKRESERPKSRFMNKLQQAMENSERIRNQKSEQN